MMCENQVHLLYVHVIVLVDMSEYSATTLATRRSVGAWIGMDEKFRELEKGVQPNQLVIQQVKKERNKKTLKLLSC